MGAAIQDLLKQVDLEKEIAELKEELKTATGQKQKLSFGCLDAFISLETKPEWMILNILPVIPPDLRPMLQLDGTLCSSDLNDLGTSKITNNHLARLFELNAPGIIVQNEKRILRKQLTLD